MKRKPMFECDWKGYPYDPDIIVSDDGRIVSYKSGKYERHTHRGYHFEYVEEVV